MSGVLSRMSVRALLTSSRQRRLGALGALCAAVALVAGGSLLLGAGMFGAGSSARGLVAGPSGTPATSAAPTTTPGGSATSEPSESPAATATPAPPRLPTLLGAIGDSFTQGFDISPEFVHHREYPQYSWAVGWAKGDGVFSLRERFEALGARLTMVDVARESRKMSDAPRQARQVVAQAQKLAPGQTAFVTIELGTNDLCHQPKTSPTAFKAQFRSAMDILVEGLPPGSRILVLSVPDFGHIHDVIAAHRPTRLYFERDENQDRCAPFVGSKSPMSYLDALVLMDDYNDGLADVCADVEGTYGPSDTLHCTTDVAGLAERDFTIADISKADHFHFSYSGQNKIAAAAWQHTPWATLALPSDAAQ